MFNIFKNAGGSPQAVWESRSTNFIGMQGAALVAKLPTRDACFKELRALGFKPVSHPSLTSEGLEWERDEDWGPFKHFNIRNSNRALAVVDVEPGSDMRRWEITAIFWDERGSRIENLKLV